MAQLIVLAVVQGLTEFLPVSSTARLVRVLVGRGYLAKDDTGAYIPGPAVAALAPLIALAMIGAACTSDGDSGSDTAPAGTDAPAAVQVVAAEVAHLVVAHDRVRAFGQVDAGLGGALDDQPLDAAADEPRERDAVRGIGGGQVDLPKSGGRRHA